MIQIKPAFKSLALITALAFISFISIAQNVGIGTTTPHANLQLNNVFNNRRIVLWEDVNNDHQFYGFGINDNTLRYQIANTLNSHVFYAATSSTTSSELMRIQGNGNVGIGTITPNSRLEVSQSFSVFGPSGIFGVNTTYSPLNSTVLLAGFDGLTNGPQMRFESTTPGFIDIGLNSSGDFVVEGNDDAKLTVQTNGDVGIGTITPASKLQIIGKTTTTNFQMTAGGTDGFVLKSDAAGNASWVNPNSLPSAETDPKVGSNTTNYLSKWNGTALVTSALFESGGNVGIGMATPHAILQISNFISNRRIILWEDFNNDHQFYGFGINNNTLRYQVANTQNSHIFYVGTSSTTSTELMRIQGNGNVGIGNVSPGFRLDVFGNVRLTGGYNTFNSSADNTEGNLSVGSTAAVGNVKFYVKSILDFGVFIENTTAGKLGLYVLGNAAVSGTLSKGGGSFKIDHPLDPENKYLYHSFVESPDMMNVYNGNTTTNSSGEAVVQMPDWFEALNRDFRYQLTVMGQFAQAMVGEKLRNNRFTIKTDKPNVEVSWQITGIRHDAFANKNRIPVEENKTTESKGKYLHPDSFGKSAEMGENKIKPQTKHK